METKQQFLETSELVGFCDLSQTRMDFANKTIVEDYGYHAVPTYNYTEFDKMIEETKPDIVIVTSIDKGFERKITIVQNYLKELLLLRN